ncbi:apyrase isoform X2 [Bacillus rossius redtenbacheri]|uniref:apyrase isoform X2 n=1 Tax=Bacillus rossius redtenbacheri TaxID=93214 RepID=UPI002FDD691F
MGHSCGLLKMLFFLLISSWYGVCGVVLREEMEGAPADDELFELSIVHWNDFHARFEETSWSSGACPEGREDSCVGGIARVRTEVLRLLAERPENSVLLNAGDVFQGTLWYTLFRWNVTARFMNMLPHDALVLGNHEFDHGIEGVVPFMKNVNFPVVVCNIDDSDEPTFQGLYNKSIVIERAGRKIGIVGFILSTTNEIAATGRLRFLDEAEAVGAEVEELKARGVDVVIALSHAGYDIDQQVARKVPDLDVIVGGHSHSLLFTGTPPGGDVSRGPYPTVVEHDDGRKVLVVQAGAYTKYLGHLVVNFSSAGEPVSWAGNPILMNTSITQDPEVLAAMEPYRNEVKAIGDTQVGSTKYVNRAPENAWTYAPIAILNSGGIRAAIVETNDGKITYNDLVTAQPFDNSVDTMELQGKHLLEALEQSVSSPWSSGDNNLAAPRSTARQFSGYGFLQYSGVRVTYNVSRPVGSRVQELGLLCDECLVPEYRALDPDKWYRVAIASFLAGGGDGFRVFPDNMRNHVTGRTDVEIFMEYLTKHSPIIQGEDGRITVIQEGE